MILMCLNHGLMMVQECGVPFVSQHTHSSEFNPDDWVCGVCLLFDPFKADFANVELSQDPVVKQDPADALIVAAEVPLRFNLVNQLIVGVWMLWLEAWIFWILDFMIHFFPVVV